MTGMSGFGHKRRFPKNSDLQLVRAPAKLGRLNREHQPLHYVVGNRFG
jgi:hypothetical protein